jgi:ElaB/YqjD/DUF883 family membrane-anchored ribosome-binding protein
MASAVPEATFDAAREARVLTSKAVDAVQQKVREAERTYRIARRRAEDIATDATTSIRRRPLATVGVALGIGLAVGAAGALAATACRGLFRSPSR